MRIFVPKETAPGEKRAPVVPETAKKLVALGVEVAVETGIGASIYRTDTEYKNAGVSVVDDRWVGLADADAVLRLQKPPVKEVAHAPGGLCSYQLSGSVQRTRSDRAVRRSRK